MNVRGRKRTRTSVQYCQEKLNCASENAEARYECENCRTLQCTDCEIKLHEHQKKIFHDRKILDPPPVELLCENQNCKDKNYADIRCNNCERNYCYECNDKLHNSTKRKQHKRIIFRDYLAEKNKPPVVEEEVDFKLDLSTDVDEQEVTHQLDIGSFNSSEERDIFRSLEDMSLNEHQTKFYTLSNPSSGLGDVIQPLTPFGNTKLTMPQGDHHHGVITRADIPYNDDENSLNLIAPPNQSPRILSAPKDQGLHLSSTSDKSDSSRPSIPDVASGTDQALEEAMEDMAEIDLTTNSLEYYKDCGSFLLVDENENIKVTEEEFVTWLKCDANDTVKVVSIFGNTGDGKSHTLNHAFFGGKEVFQTSSDQSSCTVGVWAAFDPIHKAVIIDTEGLLGISTNQNQRTRLLLKVLAISDVMIYRSRAERLHSDLFQFIGDASKAYLKHFIKELKLVSEKCHSDVSQVGPSVIVFHETHHTQTLGSGNKGVQQLKEKFSTMKLDIQAFRNLEYVGTRTGSSQTDFQPLVYKVKEQLRNTQIRTPRKPSIVYNTLLALNKKFNLDVNEILPSTFPDQYFTCPTKCLSCGVNCCLSMNHENNAKELNHQGERENHCIYQHQYDNKVYLCRKCSRGGHKNVVVPKAAAKDDNAIFALAKYAVSGYVLECPRCGIIYRSRQYWYGNKDPEADAVATETRHVWPNSDRVLGGTHNAARRFLDGVNYVTETVSSLSAKPTKMVTDWVQDRIAPPYWKPNAELLACGICEKAFEEDESKHHCRACGGGFCDGCSSKKRPVPERGWGQTPVRVCDNCYDGSPNMTESSSSEAGDAQITARVMMEGVTNTLGVVASAIDYPMGMLKDSARPAYWIPDHEITNCCVCEEKFSAKLRIHHCRACGHGVCKNCSPELKPVPARGWDQPVRVCRNCSKKLDF